MIALIQRVSRASVRVDGKETGSIENGMLILLGVHRTDTPTEMLWLVKKCALLRIFPDDDGRMTRSIQEAGGEVLVVSQFTLYGNANKGNRPSFVESAPPEIAEPLYEKFKSELSTLLERKVACGKFGAFMDVELINDGPVTLWLEKLAESNN